MMALTHDVIKDLIFLPIHKEGANEKMKKLESVEFLYFFGYTMRATTDVQTAQLCTCCIGYVYMVLPVYRTILPAAFCQGRLKCVDR